MVPSGWQIRAISDLLERVNKPVIVNQNSKYREIGIRSHCKGIFHKGAVSGKSLGNKRVFHIEPDCFVMNIVFAWEQAVAKTTKKELGMIASHRFPMFKPKNNLCDIDYILYLFKTAYGKHLLSLASPGGAGRNKTLGQVEFARMKISVPPFDEQKKIAKILSTWDKSITITEQLLEKSQAQKKSLMQQLFTSKKRFPGHLDNWKNYSLGELGDTFTGLSGKSKGDFGSGLPYIPYINIYKNNAIDVSSFEYVKINTDEHQSKVQYGDIFFTTSSETVVEVGMSSVLLNHVGEVYLNSFCFGFRLFNFQTLLPEYARYLLRSAGVRRAISVMGQGATRYNLSKKQLMKLKIGMPSLEEQQKIAATLATADREIKALEQRLVCLKQEKKSLMHQLLTGKRRVKVWV